MTRGNQRELARARNLKKQQQIAKTAQAQKGGGRSLEERKQRDAEIMRQKQMKSKAAAESGGSGSSK